LQAFLPPGAKIKRRTTVGVRCKAGKPWKIYLPVTVSAYAKVMVAKHAIAPNSTIRKPDISWVKRDISSLGYGYLSSISENGYKSRRSIAQGAVLTPNMVTAASIITKGQRINLRSKNGAVQVSMQGQALENAALGERIRVKNLSSGKQIEGIVKSPHEVLIY
ncbi:MAG: flagellar basal body P-ring formation chaperone FlgA, partial [Spongiibacteraceae bacterium]